MCVVLSYSSGGTSCEFGDFSAIHCLTGWLPEDIPLQYVNTSLLTCLLSVYHRQLFAVDCRLQLMWRLTVTAVTVCC